MSDKLQGPVVKCKNCGVEIVPKNKEWRHVPTGFWKCFTTNAEPGATKQGKK